MNQDTIIDQILRHFKIKDIERNELKKMIQENILKYFVINVFEKLPEADKAFLRTQSDKSTPEDIKKMGELLTRPEYQEDYAKAMMTVISPMIDDEKIVSPEKRKQIYDELISLLESSQTIAGA